PGAASVGRAGAAAVVAAGTVPAGPRSGSVGSGRALRARLAGERLVVPPGDRAVRTIPVRPRVVRAILPRPARPSAAIRTRRPTAGPVLVSPSAARPTR